MMSEPADDLLDRVNRALDDYANYERTIRAITDLTTLEEELDSARGDLAAVTAGFAALEQAGVTADRPRTDSLVNACRDAAAQVRRSRSLPQDPPLRIKSFRDIAQDASASIKEAWQAFVTARMPGLEGLGSLAGTLASVGADRTQVAALEDGVRELRALSRQTPDESAVGRVAEAVTAIRTALAELVGGSGEDDNEVRRFIEAVAGGGAHVGALTPTVRAWMGSSGIEQSFRIVPGRPASG